MKWLLSPSCKKASISGFTANQIATRINICNQYARIAERIRTFALSPLFFQPSPLHHTLCPNKRCNSLRSLHPTTPIPVVSFARCGELSGSNGSIHFSTYSLACIPLSSAPSLPFMCDSSHPARSFHLTNL